MIPTLLADFLVANQQTPWEVYQEATRLGSIEDSLVSAEDTALVRAWAMGAAHSATTVKAV